MSSVPRVGGTFRGKNIVHNAVKGRVPFPKVGELPYFITLNPYSFYWFQLVDM